jgi:hypothetical protein
MHFTWRTQMKIVYRFAAILAIFALALGIASAEDNQDQRAESFLMGYINLLNTGDYASAYNMMDNRSDSYQQFVAGYEHTVRIVPYFGFGGVAAGSTYVTTILLGYQDDGSIETYYGYFQLHSGQLYTPIRNNGGWVLGNARFQLIADGLALANNAMDELLSREWQETVTVNAPTVVNEMNTDEAYVLLSYYDLINTGYYSDAWNMWLSAGEGPASRSYAPSYTNFVSGYADTDYVTVYLGTKQALNPPNALLDYLPAVLVGEHTDGSFVTYSGCYAMGRYSTGGIGIVNGRFSLLKDDTPTSDEIFNALASVNCASLGMGIS